MLIDCRSILIVRRLISNCFLNCQFFNLSSLNYYFELQIIQIHQYEVLRDPSRSSDLQHLLCSSLRVCRTPPTASIPRNQQLTSHHSIENTKRATGTCSLGIARWFGSISWDVTIYNVPQADRQDANIIATLTNAAMDKGDSITIPSPASNITVTNVDNAPVFDYDTQVINASITDPATGQTKVRLDFALQSGNVTWSTDDCDSVSVVFTAGLEGWTCNFPCSVEAALVKDEI
jgi:hypothetical protein